MDGSTIEDFVMKGSSSFIEDSCGDSVVETGTSSTSSSYEDTDDDADDCGTKPSALYNKFTWTIEDFSKVDKRELRSEQYDAGGYKWYILIYPQGCDVSNHLSLFLCVANHDKFLPGWSHFAQFTIAVVNKDPNKSKYSDTLHRFWKKEHDWGWKKFMELSKLSDGFINADTDTLVINAQVQVIRESTHRPFRCLDREYRRELVRVYSSNVEQICWRFFEERRGRLSKLIEDKLRWSSFRAFWLGINQNARRCMSRDTTEAILKAVVKHFFIEKEVTSTLVMDSLYYGLKALEGRITDRRSGPKLESMDESPVPLVCIEKDMFVLADDVLLLLERAAMVRHQPLLLKDEKASQNRTKDGNFGEELNKVIIQRDERRFTELGRRTLELFILVHIFSSRIEIAYNEAVALKRQEELIREEEAAGQVENELRAKRLAAEKEKRTKKKQAKQKRNTRKGKDKGRDDKPDAAMQDKQQTSGPSNGRISDSSSTLEKLTVQKIATLEEASDASDAGDDAPEAAKPESDNRDVYQDAKTLEVRFDAGHEMQNREVEREKRSPPIIDDSCSTCSTDSASSVTINSAHNRNSSPKNKGRTSSMRVKNHTLDQICDTRGGKNPSPECANADNSTVARPEPETVVPSPKNLMQSFRQNSAKEEVEPLQKASTFRDRVQLELLSKSRTVESSPSLPSPARKPTLSPQQTKKSNATASTTTTASANTTAAATSTTAASTTATSTTATSASASTITAASATAITATAASAITTASTAHEPPSSSPSQTEKSLSLAAKSPTTTKSEAQKLSTPSIPRPSSAPLVPSRRTTSPAVSTVQALPLLSRSMSSAGRLDTDPSPSPSAPSFIYRNPLPSRTSDFTPLPCSTSFSQPLSYSQAPSPLPPIQSSMRIRHPPSNPGYAFVPAMPESLRAKQHMGEVSDEFPHIGIINDLLDEDHTVSGRSQQHHHRSFERQYTFPRDVGSSDGTCRFERSYGEGSQRPDRFSVGPLQGARDARTVQMEPSVYASGRIDGIHRSQWPYRASMLNSGGDDADGYPYQLMDYGNGYSMF